jgi:hypothetical protein
MVSCNGFYDGGATASATGGTAPYTYSWNNSATTASITGVGAGTYSVTITDANGCTDNTNVTITQPTSLVASAIVDSTVACNGYSNGGATASASGGTAPYSYIWSNSATTASITGVTAGTYSVTITDANGCSDNSSVTITEPTSLAASAIVDSMVTCNAYSNGGATASASGGTAPYTYSWNNSATTASITGVGAGTYSVTITDANGCTDNTSVTITQPTALQATASVDANATCVDNTDGKVSVIVSGGTTAYNYLWNTGATTNTASNLGIGKYYVDVTDMQGCISIDTVSVGV